MAVNPDFSDLFKTFNAGSVASIIVVSRRDLIASKRVTGRPQDLLDADELERP